MTETKNDTKTRMMSQNRPRRSLEASEAIFEGQLQWEKRGKGKMLLKNNTDELFRPIETGNTKCVLVRLC